MHCLASLSLVFFSGWAFYAPQEEPSIPKFRVTSSRVIVDFVAFDKQGRIVTDLRKDEIEILEDGKKQSIDAFFPPGQLPASAQPRTPAAPPAASTTRDQPTVSAPSGARPPTQTVIVIDSRAIDSNNFVHSVNAIRAFIEDHLGAGHSVMITEINRGLRTLTPLTRDKNVLLSAVNQLKPQTVYNPLDSRAIFTDRYFDELQLQVMYLRDGLSSLCQSLSGQPGRKHVVFFSEGYPVDPLKLAEQRTRELVSESKSSDVRQAAARDVESRKDPQVISMLRAVVSMANSFGVSFYTIDARGLVAVPGIGTADRSGNVAGGVGAGVRVAEAGRADIAPAPGAGARTGEPETAGPTEKINATFTLTDLDRIEDAQNTLIALAAGTNGLAFYNTNDLGTVLRYSTFEQENYYLAGYAPNTKRKTGQFHSITVKTSRPGVTIRSRIGYLDVPENELQTERLSAALRHPELFGQLTPMLQITPGGGGIQAVVGVPASQIQFRPKGDQFGAEILFRGMIYDAGDKPISKDFSIARGFNLALPREQYQGLGNQPLLAQSEVKLTSGKYKVVLVVEDRLAGTMGATSQEFVVP